MKILTSIFLFIILSSNCNSQNFQLKLIGETQIENQILDSLDYNSNHVNSKSIFDEIDMITKKLSKIGYLENQFIETKQENDSCFSAQFRVGKKTKSIHIYIGEKKSFFPTKKNQNKKSIIENNIKDKEVVWIKNLIHWNTSKDTLSIPFTETENFIAQALEKLELNGYSFSKIQLNNIKKENDKLYSELQIEIGTSRKINSIIIKQNSNNEKKNIFPTGHLIQLNRKFRKQIFNKKNVDEIYRDFGKFRFVSQLKYPEILFTKDSTKVYVYLEEKKTNTFDGFIGFANNNNSKIKLNGYLDLKLENALKAGEQFSLLWKSDGNNQKTFKSSIEIPYLFKSPLGIIAKLDIFKQDSIFQNTKSEINLGYYKDYNSRIFLGYQTTESSDIQNTKNSQISYYKSSYFTSNIDYSRFNNANSIFALKTKLNINLGFGTRNSIDSKNNLKSLEQFFFNMQVSHNFYLNQKNSININYHNYFLKSETYIINELYRFGGIKTIRGFGENSFQANWMTSIQSEYRHTISPSLYLHSILDYCYFEDKSFKINNQLTGIGAGIGLNTKSGLLKFAYANGINKNNDLKFNNSIIHISYSIQF